MGDFRKSGRHKSRNAKLTGDEALFSIFTLACIKVHLVFATVILAHFLVECDHPDDLHERETALAIHAGHDHRACRPKIKRWRLLD